MAARVIKGINHEFFKEFVYEALIISARREQELKEQALETGQLPFIRRGFVRKFARKPMKQLVFMKPQQMPAKETQKEAALMEKLDLGRINELIDDKGISMIECVGSDKNLKIFKNSEVSETDIALDKKEIESIIKKFSEKTSTPLGRVFIASYARITINAIKSDFLGYRFIITKEISQEEQNQAKSR